MVFEIVDHLIRNSGMTMVQGWYITAAIWLVTVIFFCWTFRKEAHSTARCLMFILVSSFFILTLILDTRLIFLPLFLVVWKNKGWLRLIAALLSTVIIVDGLLLVLYSLYYERSWRHLVVAGVCMVLVLCALNTIYGSPLPHFIASMNQGPLMDVVEFEIPPVSKFNFIQKMYSSEWWGSPGIALSLWAAFCAVMMWLMKDPLLCLLTTGIVIMVIFNITLSADLWRYFAPHMMIFFGQWSPWKVVSG